MSAKFHTFDGIVDLLLTDCKSVTVYTPNVAASAQTGPMLDLVPESDRPSASS